MKTLMRYAARPLLPAAFVAVRLLATSPDSFTTPNEFFGRGTPTFVVGTIGDATARHGVLAQVDSIRSLAFPDAPVVIDTAIDPAKGVSAWPRNPVLYGGPHVNTVLQRLAGSLPFVLEPGRLVIGGEVFEGTAFRLIAVVPADAGDGARPAHPEFVLFAGAGTPGVGGINVVHHGSDPILIADEFGPLLSGTWRRNPDGRLEAVFSQPRARRIAWRTFTKTFAAAQGGVGRVKIHFPEMLPVPPDADAVCAACARGLSTASTRLGIAAPCEVTVYVYPDRGSKRSLTGDAGDGRSDVLSHSIHVVTYDPAEGGPLEKLLTHEGTHVIMEGTSGVAGSALIGEGLAVWCRGGYGGVTLERWAGQLTAEFPALRELAGPQLRRLPEQTAYPLGGLLVDIAVEKVGLAAVKSHLYPATAETWESSCRAAGTTSADLEAALRARLATAKTATPSR